MCAGIPTMINVSAIQMQQFGVQFYQASLTAKDIDKLVRFEVLSYGEQHHPPVRGKKRAGAVSKVNWDLLERRIARQREGVPAADHPAEDRRTRRLLRTVPPGPRPAVDSGRRHHLLRREAVVLARGGRLEPRRPEGARSARASCGPSTGSTGCWRCTPTSSGSARRRSRCRRSSSTSCPRTTSSRCS